jgi:hypothetical protein
MNMKPLSENLTILIATAEDMIRKPAHRLPEALPEGFSEIAAAVRRAHEQPCDGIRSTRAAMMMCIAIDGFFSGDAGDQFYQSEIGSILPKLRSEAWQAMKNERGVAEESAR